MSDRWTPNADGLVVVRDRPLHIMLAIDSAYPGIICGLEPLARKIQRERIVMSRRVVRPRPVDAPDVGAADHAVLSPGEMIARGVAAILTVRERRHGDKADGPPRCLRCHRELTGKVPPFRGIGRECWRSMMRIKATDPDAPTMPTGPDYVVVRDRQGRLHHNVPGISCAKRVGFLRPAVHRTPGRRLRSWNLARHPPIDRPRRRTMGSGPGGMFYDEFLRDVPDDGTIIRGADVLAWIMEHTDGATHDTPLILRGDARKIPLPDESVSAIVTDPQRDHGRVSSA
jgi:hypothetical protein